MLLVQERQALTKTHSTRRGSSDFTSSPTAYFIAMLPNDLLIFLNDRIHCRQIQIKQLATLLDVRMFVLSSSGFTDFRLSLRYPVRL